jgi:hypothetical protein
MLWILDVSVKFIFYIFVLKMTKDVIRQCLPLLHPAGNQMNSLNFYYCSQCLTVFLSVFNNLYQMHIALASKVRTVEIYECI